MNFLRRSARWLAATVTSVLTAITHPRAGWGWSMLNRTGINYAGEVKADANSIVQACVRWAQRNSSEAPPILEQWNEERRDWDQIYFDELLSLVAHPNGWYSGNTMLRAVIADYMLAGDAYLLKVRARSGRVVQLWWAPESTMTPKGDDRDDTVFISHYEYRPGGGEATNIRVEDVWHLQDGQDPENPRKGLSAMKSLFREIFTDDEAANMTAVLLKNMGVPGVIISPKSGTMPVAAGKEIKEQFRSDFGGDKRGEALVTGGAVDIHQFGFSPEQMQMRSLRGIPEERITAVVGINSAVLGLGAGLATTKVGATLKEYREEAFESFLVPLWRALAEGLTEQLIPDFKGVDSRWRLVFDLTKVRVLQEDEDRRADNLGRRLEAGGITVAEYRRALGMIVLPEHEVYLRKSGVIAVPAGLSPEEQGAVPVVEPTMQELVAAELERQLAVRGAQELVVLPAPQRKVQIIERTGKLISRVITEEG